MKLLILLFSVFLLTSCNKDVGIIGGADGPTSIIVSEKSLDDIRGNIHKLQVAFSDRSFPDALDTKLVVHPNTKTQAILKPSIVNSKDNVDEICVTAYSYDIESRVDIVSVRGGDGKFHNVSVSWDDYLPLKVKNNFFVGMYEDIQRII